MLAAWKLLSYSWSMKIYLAILVTLVLGAYAVDVQLMHHYQPTPAALARTTVLHGQLTVVERHGGSTAQVDGVPLLCAVDFIGVNADCRSRVRGLVPGAHVAVTLAHVAAIAGGPMTMAIAIDGVQVYARTPAQVIDEYIASSQRRLLDMPGFVLFVLVLGPLLLFSDRVGEFMSALG